MVPRYSRGVAPYRESEGRLGAIVREHAWLGSGPLAWIGVVFVAIPAVVLLALPMGENDSFMSYVGLAVFFVGLPALGVAMLVSAYRLRGNAVRLHERGLWHRWSGVESSVGYDEVVSIRSAVVQQIRNGIAGPVQHDDRVRTQNGRLLRITHGFSDVDALATELQRRTLAARLAHARARLAAKETLVLGPFELSRRALFHAGTGKLPLEAGPVFTVAGGIVTVHADEHGVWATERASEVPDLDMLEVLAPELTERRRRKARSAGA